MFSVFPVVLPCIDLEPHSSGSPAPTVHQPTGWIPSRDTWTFFLNTTYADTEQADVIDAQEMHVIDRCYHTNKG